MNELLNSSGRIRVIAIDMNDNADTSTTCLFEVGAPGTGGPEFLFYLSNERDSTTIDTTLSVLQPNPPDSANIADTAWAITENSLRLDILTYLNNPDSGAAATWITPRNSVDSIPSGRWRFVRWGYRTGDSDSLDFYWKVYKTNTAGFILDTLFSTQDTLGDLLDAVSLVDTIFFPTDSFSFDPDSNRILIEVWVQDVGDSLTANSYFLYDARYDPADSTAAPSIFLRR